MNDDIKLPAAKAVSGVAVLIWSLDWGRIAQILAALYTLCLITEWAWKRVLKPAAQRLGWIKGRPSQFLDSTDAVPFDEATP